MLFSRSSSRRRCRVGAPFGGCCYFISASAGEHVAQCVVALVTGVLKNASLCSAKFIFTAPCAVPHAWILDLKLIQNPIWPHTREPLRDFQFLPSSLQSRRLREVSGLNALTGRALVPAYRVAHPGPQSVGAMLGADVNHAHVVHHFNNDRDRVLGLCESDNCCCRARAA